MAETDDLKLVRDTLGGDPKAYGSLVDRYQKPVFNAAFRIVSNYEDAKDVTQTVFVKAYEKLDSFKSSYKFFSWIYKMTINEAINFLNRKIPGTNLNEDIPSRENTPEERFRHYELGEIIQDALMQLSVEYRVVIVLRHFGDVSYNEISYILGIPEKTVKSRLYSARRMLNGILTKRGIDAHD